MSLVLVKSMLYPNIDRYTLSSRLISAVNNMINAPARTILLLGLLSMLAACGQGGSLYLPDESTAGEQSAAEEKEDKK